HASLRSAIERIFGILKQRFAILVLPSRFARAYQVRLATALAALNNFIRQHDYDDHDSF
ncbi:hypothetical protein OBBRIDRAFT_716098, partial [Obba rivulosa]